MWRNRYTRTFEGRVEKSLGVQVPPSTPYKIMRLYSSNILYSRSEDAEPQCEAFIGFSGFAYVLSEAKFG